MDLLKYCMPSSSSFPHSSCFLGLVWHQSFSECPASPSRPYTSCFLLQLGTSRRRKLLQTASIGGTPTTSSQPGDGQPRSHFVPAHLAHCPHLPDGCRALTLAGLRLCRLVITTDVFCRACNYNSDSHLFLHAGSRRRLRASVVSVRLDTRSSFLSCRSGHHLLSSAPSGQPEQPAGHPEPEPPSGQAVQQLVHRTA